MGKKKEYEFLNDLTYITIYNRLKNLALNMFEWDGLPPLMKQEYIETILFYNAIGLFFEDSKMGLMVLKALPSSNVNVYGEFTTFIASGFNYNKAYTIEEKNSRAVLIRNNMLMTNTADTIQLYAKELADIKRATQVNVNAQKTPYIVACDDKDLFTMKNIYKQIDGNTPVIFADKNLNLNSLEVFLTPAPFVADKLTDHFNQVTNEVMTFLGINNANTDKKERLVTDEVTSNNDLISKNAEYMLKTRQRACKEINEMFGLNITVKRKEVEESGTVHSGDKGTNK